MERIGVNDSTYLSDQLDRQRCERREIQNGETGGLAHQRIVGEEAKAYGNLTTGRRPSEFSLRFASPAGTIAKVTA